MTYQAVSDVSWDGVAGLVIHRLFFLGPDEVLQYKKLG